MKEIDLGKGMTALVDDEDFDNLNQWKWHAQKSGNTYYAVRTVWLTKTSGTSVRMHRIILGLQGKEVVDHKDHNGLNNQKYNLRICSKSQNGGNRIKTKGSSRFLGVHFCKTRKVWVTQIQHNKKGINVGLFNNEVDAAIAYNQKAIELHGEFANLNQIGV